MDPKPCPFCGSGAVAHGIFAGGYMMVRCMRCDASSPSSKKPVPEVCIDIRPWIDEAIEAWNRRSPTPREQELREALEGLLAMVDQMDRPPRAGGGVMPVDKALITRKARAALTNGGAS